MIYVDGVDVSGCQYCLRNGEVCGYVENMGGCKDRPHCLYKKLARAEKKIVRLKKANDRLTAQKEAYLTCYKAKHGDIKARLFRLEEENEKLKHMVKDLEQEDRKLGIIDNYMGQDLDYWINLNNTNECLEKENEELKKQIDLDAEGIANYMKNTTNLKKELSEMKRERNILFDQWVLNNRQQSKNKELKRALEETRNSCTEMLETIEEEGKPNKSIRDTIWCKNIPCCTLYELIENTQIKIDEVLR